MTKSKPLFRELLVSSRRIGSDAGNRITCVVADGLCMSFAIDIGEEVGIPIICFDSTATCNFWINLCFPKLVEAGEFPFKGNDLDTPIASVPGMEHFLRCRDYTSFCRNVDSVRQKLQIILNEVQQSVRAQALIFNTFEDLEGSILIHARSQCPNIYTIGPLHAHIKSRLTTAPTISSNTLWEEDASCMTWLESKPLKSVIYVSFGSIATVTKDQLIEFWHGLINSGKRFLWVIRSDFIDKKSQIPTELLEGTKERGYIVGWAPQEKVLAHRAIGGFLTHSGWNSTLESIVAGVPMICWPYFGDQQINSRFVGEVWKLGLDMKDTCDRVIIEKMIRDLMDERRDEFTESTGRMAELTKQAINKGGSSYSNFDRLIGLIRSMDDD
ncbi:7-deoxyloganetic acid glucosyltransferase [Sarracenia purpurea var. burkii]